MTKETEPRTTADGTRYFEVNPFRNDMTLAEMQRMQQMQALATYGRIVLGSSEVQPAKVQGLTAKEVLEASEAFTDPRF